MTIGQNIKYLRESRQWTQEELARILGMSNQAVSKWEVDAAVPRMGVFQQLSDLFHIPKSVIIEGNVERYLTQKNSPNVQHVFSLFNQLPEEQKQMVLDMIEVALKTHGLLDK